MKQPQTETIACSNCPANITRPVGATTLCSCGTLLGVTVTK